MPRSRHIRAALPRLLVVLAVLCAGMVGLVGTSLAATAGDVPNPSSGSWSSGYVVAGMSLGTFTWAIVGLILLALGFIAASRSGRSGPAAAATPTPVMAAGVRSFQPSTHEAQGDQTSVAVAL